MHLLYLTHMDQKSHSYNVKDPEFSLKLIDCFSVFVNSKRDGCFLLTIIAFSKMEPKHQVEQVSIRFISTF